MTGGVDSVGIVEDDPHYQAFIEQLVGTTPGLACAFTTDNVQGALALFGAHGPRICLVDLALPDGSGIDLVRHIKTSSDGRVLVLSVLGDQATVMEALRAGADGYVLKDMPGPQIVESIRQTLAGFAPISPQVAVYLTRLLSSPASAEPETRGAELSLTDREAETLSMFAKGLSYREAAEVLGVSPHTISDFVKKIYRKLDVHSRGEAVFEAQSLGLIDRQG
jgi:DNA-binding NarL/FixJ family response regulator